MVALSSSEQVIRSLYQITNDYNKGFNHQVNALLCMGLEAFKLDIGILSRIKRNSYKVKHCVTPDGIEMQPGDRFDFDSTYCSITCAARGPVALEHVGQHDTFGSHPAYKSFGLESYIGVPIHRNDKLYGTLNFSSSEPYPRRFRDLDIEALQLMASWIEVELIRRQQEKQLNSLNKKLKIQAYYDSLTNIPNRRGMFRTLQKELNKLIRSKGKGTLAIIDIDNFKQVNDTYGHQKGDEVLVLTAEKITDSMRDYDFVARYGGEEFLLWLPDADEKECTAVCQRIMQKIAGITLAEKPLTISIGACHFRCDNESHGVISQLLDSLIARADKALYQAKNNGRNQLVSYTD
ncbi:MAG: sensor domain-containing diguanylate cyclase [Gammaproteobacteria bacterium]|nr:sensor domain-containing diguanylate cyclase [Gammaproteobacteria bacterium]